MNATSAAAAMPDDLRDALRAVAPSLAVVRALGATLDAVPPIEKKDGSPVTAADYAVQAVVVAGLRAAAGDRRVPLLGEESASGLASARRPDAVRAVVDAVRAALGWMDEAEVLRLIDGDEPRSGAPHWTIDPIDGTRGFVLGAQCSVCLARVEGRDVTLAVMGCPRMGPTGDVGVHANGPGVLYGAVRGGGAFECDAAGQALRSMRVDPWRGPGIRWARSLNRSGSLAVGRTEPLVRAIGPILETRMDSQCKYALVARGDADLVVRTPRTAGAVEQVWDHASGALLAAEAGAEATDACGRPLDFGHGALLAANVGVLVAARGLHERAVQALAPALRLPQRPAEAGAGAR
jgi:3'(2'), 5'-bisphosphate nucleotidase